MLVLTRKAMESIQIGGNVGVVVLPTRSVAGAGIAAGTVNPRRAIVSAV